MKKTGKITIVQAAASEELENDTNSVNSEKVVSILEILIVTESDVRAGGRRSAKVTRGEGQTSIFRVMSFMNGPLKKYAVEQSENYF